MTGERAPDAAEDVPAPMAALHRDWNRTRIWRNQVTTWRLDHEDGRSRYLKAGPRGWWPGLGAEAARMRWAGAHLPVPEVLALDHDAGQEWLLTAALPGKRITNDDLRSRPEVMVPLLARGLRRIHEAPRHGCPFVLTAGEAVAVLRDRVERRLFDPERSLDGNCFPGLTAEAAVGELERTLPRQEDPVLCHGDYCPPNVLIVEDEVSGFVDLCDLAVADRWRDLAICPWALPVAGLGPEWEELFYRAYGIAPDLGRIAFHRLLYDLGRLVMTGRDTAAGARNGGFR